MLDLYLEQNHTDARLPLDESYLQKVGEVALGFFEPSNYELSIVCVDRFESQHLNFTYRQKDKPTNVLSFPSDLPDEILGELDSVPLGDLVICMPVVLSESDTQGKTPLDHFTHLVVHGILHLLGYDHELGEQEALEMEQLEIEILSKLGIENPYRDDEY